MKYIKIDQYNEHAGQFILHTHEPLCQLGKAITVTLREASEHDGQLAYTVEIMESMIHERDESFSRNRVAKLLIEPTGPNAGVCVSMFGNHAFGRSHRLSLVPYEIGERFGYVLAIDGLVWDGRLVHVKDIAC